MNKIKTKLFLLIFAALIPNMSLAVNFASIEYDVPIDYSKIDKNALADQANLLFNHFEQITDEEY